MEYGKLRGTGLTVSRVSLGTMTFGGQLDEQGSIRIMKEAMEAGVNFIDTADIYTAGQSETIVGKGLAGCRDEIVLASKAGGPSEAGQNGMGLNRKHLLSSVEKSLKRLNTDYLDIFYMHFPDPKTPIEESLRAMDTLVQSGKVRYIGMSNYAAWQLTEAAHICDKHHWAGPSVTESVYNVITRGLESELVPCIKRKDIGLVVYNPIAGGLLSGKHSKEKPVENTRFSDLGGYYQRYWNDDTFGAMERLSQIAAEGGMTLLELALRWSVSFEHVSSVIIGVSKPEHLVQNLALLEKGALSADVLAQCDEVWKVISGNRFSYNR